MPAERIGIVLGGVGECAVVWETAVLAGLADEGIDPRNAEAILGTSAGSVVASRVAMGADPRSDAEELAEQPPGGPPLTVRRAVWSAVRRIMAIWNAEGVSERERRRRIGCLALEQPDVAGSEEYVARLAAGVPSGPWPERLVISAVDLEGDRMVFDATSHVSLVRAVGGARAVPGYVAPVRVGDRRVIDAGLVSGANADILARSVDVAIVLTTASFDGEAGPLDRTWNSELEKELSLLADRNVSTLVVRPSTEARRAIGDDFTRLPDPAGAVDAGLDQGHRVAHLLALH